MKSLKDILIIVKNHYSEHTDYYSGICSCIYECYFQSLITEEERVTALEYVKTHPPHKYKRYNLYGETLDLREVSKGYEGYFWKAKTPKPRLRWLSRHIDLLS